MFGLLVFCFFPLAKVLFFFFLSFLCFLRLWIVRVCILTIGPGSYGRVGPDACRTLGNR